MYPSIQSNQAQVFSNTGTGAQAFAKPAYFSPHGNQITSLPLIFDQGQMNHRGCFPTPSNQGQNQMAQVLTQAFSQILDRVLQTVEQIVSSLLGSAQSSQTGAATGGALFGQEDLGLGKLGVAPQAEVAEPAKKEDKSFFGTLIDYAKKGEKLWKEVKPYGEKIVDYGKDIYNWGSDIVSGVGNWLGSWF